MNDTIGDEALGGDDAPDSNTVSNTARIIIIGGGIMGCGLAYHLAHEGVSDVILLEKGELTSGSTWHAAGQITHSTSSFALGKCVGYNIELYSKILEAETGQNVTWHGCGSLRLAYTEDELDWLYQTISVGRGLGFPMEIISPEEIKKLHPFYNLEGVRAALHTPEDGHVDPAGVTFALAKGASMRGVKIIRRCRVTHIEQAENGEWLVETEKGRIRCEHLVNAGGTYARQIALWSGYDLPATSMTHHYFITDPVPEFQELEQELPVVRDDCYVSGYVRMEQKSGLIGIYEKANPNMVWQDECPWEAENELFAPDYDRVMPWLENALARMKVLAERGIKRAIHGAISHPPDGNPLIGPAPGLKNYWCCCGTQIGIGWGPGLTRELARWIVQGAGDISMREFDPRRFGNYADQTYQNTKACEDYLLRHEIPFPHFNRLDARPVKPSAIYQELKTEGAVFEEVYGHERPRWFAPQGTEALDIYGFRRTKLHDIVGKEVQAVRTKSGLMDISAFTKIIVSGPDAAAFMDRHLTNKLPPPGRIGLAYLLTPSGRIELETTVIRFDENRFYLVCAAFFEQRLIDYLTFNRGKNERVSIENMSDEWGALALNGPVSGAIMSECTTADFSNKNFPWLSQQEISLRGEKLQALRLSYAGETGWEFHGPRKAIHTAFKALTKAGTHTGLKHYGSFAMNVMRMEKAFKGAGELTNEVTPKEADVMRFVALEKDFQGRKALEAETSLRWKCVYLDIEDDGISDGQGGEAVLSKGKQIGTISSIAFGHSVNKLLGFAFIAPEATEPGNQLEVIIMGQPRKAQICAKPAYDAESKKPRAEPTLIPGKHKGDSND